MFDSKPWSKPYGTDAKFAGRAHTFLAVFLAGRPRLFGFDHITSYCLGKTIQDGRDAREIQILPSPPSSSCLDKVFSFLRISSVVRGRQSAFLPFSSPSPLFLEWVEICRLFSRF